MKGSRATLWRSQMRGAPESSVIRGRMGKWLGCKLEAEAVCSTMTHARLLASCSSARGDCYFGSVPGVYAHGDKTSKKVGTYMRYAPLFNDWVFWAAKNGGGGGPGGPI